MKLSRWILIFVLILFNFILKGQLPNKRHHISINGSPNAFLLNKFSTGNTSYVGISLLPELEYSYHISANTRACLSVYWTGVKNLTFVENLGTPSNTSIQASRTSETNLAATLGLNFSLSSDDGDDTVSIPFLNSFSVGLGYGNFFIGEENGTLKVQEGFLFMFGFRVRILSFNMGRY